MSDSEMSPANKVSDVGRIVMRDCWNKCDVCGKFISFDDFNHGAVRVVIDPVDETYETLCVKHKNA